MIWGLIEVCVSIIAASLPMVGPIFFDKRGPETIIRSIRSVISARSASKTTISGSGHSKGSLGSSEDEAGRHWHELESRGQITNLVSNNNSTVGREDSGIRVERTFAATAEKEV